MSVVTRVYKIQSGDSVITAGCLRPCCCLDSPRASCARLTPLLSEPVTVHVVPREADRCPGRSACCACPRSRWPGQPRGPHAQRLLLSRVCYHSRHFQCCREVSSLPGSNSHFLEGPLLPSPTCSLTIGTSHSPSVHFPRLLCPKDHRPFMAILIPLLFMNIT